MYVEMVIVWPCVGTTLLADYVEVLGYDSVVALAGVTILLDTAFL